MVTRKLSVDLAIASHRPVSSSSRRREDVDTFSLRPLTRALMTASLVSLALGVNAGELPQGATVVNGSASVGANGNSMTITNSPNAILNWNSFSIGKDNSVHFQQQSALSQVLNRVVGRDASNILGKLSSNGRVWLINPNGVLFGKDARVDVAGLVASTLDISNNDFLAGRFNFKGGGGDRGSELLNQGSIKTSFGGRVWLLAETVGNTGIVETPGGEILLAAGKSIELIDTGMPNVVVKLTAPTDTVVNLGQLIASGGRADIHASIVNLEGIVRADSATPGADGRVQVRAEKSLTIGALAQVVAGTGNVALHAGHTLNNLGEVSAKSIVATADYLLQQGTLSTGGKGGRIALNAATSMYLDGRVDASADSGTGGTIGIETGKFEGMASGTVVADGATGGSIRIQGRDKVGFSSTVQANGESQGGTVEVTGIGVYLLNAQVAASGGSKGGTIHLGGGWQGSGDLPHAQEVFIGVGSRVNVNATKPIGKGGEVAIWSLQSSAHYGSVQALEGGRIEVSSKGELEINGDLQAGQGGQVLFDPKNLIITNGPPDALTVVKKIVSGSTASAQPAINNDDNFGFSVALDGDRMAVGVPNRDTGGLSNSGGVHLFTGVGSDYSKLAWRRVVESSSGANNMPALAGGDNFGTGLALEGDLLAIGTGRESNGAVHLFNGATGHFDNLTWKRQELASIQPGLDKDGYFGYAVAIEGDRLAVGSPGALNAVGAITLFTGVGTDFSGLTWRRNVQSSSGAANMPILDRDNFGHSIALTKDLLVVGAMTGGGDKNPGQVHLFNNAEGDFSHLTWKRKIGSGDDRLPGMPVLAEFDNFGSGVALDGSNLFVGAHKDGDGTDRGAVYIFTNIKTGESAYENVAYDSKITSGDPKTKTPELADKDHFGWRLALDGDHLAIGAIGDSLSATGRGEVHLYTGANSAGLANLRWNRKLASGTAPEAAPALDNGDAFGSSVAMAGTRLVVGAPLDDTGGPNRGAVHLFSGANGPANGLTWLTVLTSGSGAAGMPALDDNDQFGASVALDGGTLVVGAPGDDGRLNSRQDTGAVYRFSNPALLGSIIGVNYSGGANVDMLGLLDDRDRFGSAVAQRGTLLAVGAPGDDGANNQVEDGGAAYVFSPTSTQGFSRVGAGYTGDGDIDLTGRIRSGDQAGSAVALDTIGSIRLALGAPGANGMNNNAQNSGAVHLVRYDDLNLTGGTRVATIGRQYNEGLDQNVHLSSGDLFGTAVALDATHLMVGLVGSDQERGSVYSFGNVSGDLSQLSFNSEIGASSGVPALATLQSGDRFGTGLALEGSRLVVGAPGDDSGGTNRGAVHVIDGLFLGGGVQEAEVNQATFNIRPGDTNYLLVSKITSLLNAGTSVTLQANNDIEVRAPIVANNPTGKGGDLVLQAGQHIKFFADVTTDNGNLNAFVSEVLEANPAHRGIEFPQLVISPGVTIDVGTGRATFRSQGGGGFINNSGDAAIVTSGSGRYLAYFSHPNTSIEGFTTYNKHYAQSYSETVPAYAQTGNWFFYSHVPILLVAPGEQSLVYGESYSASPTFTGFIDGDTEQTAGIGGTANYSFVGAKSTSGRSSVGLHDVRYGFGLTSSLGYVALDNNTKTNELTVTARPIDASGFTVSSKVYDGTTAATVTGTPSLVGVLGSDLVAFGGQVTANFLDKNAGNNKTVRVTSSNELTGADKGNYELSPLTTDMKGDIDRRPAPVSYGGVSAQSRIYDGTTAASLIGSPDVPDLIGGDSVAFGGVLTGSFANKHTGTLKPVTINSSGLVLTGSDAPNYELILGTPPVLFADIAMKSVTVNYTGIGASEKVYDRTTVATITGLPIPEGFVPGDNVGLGGDLIGTFSNRNVGVNKDVSVDNSGLALTGTDRDNYDLNRGLAPTLHADINKRGLNVLLGGLSALDKIYDGTKEAAVIGIPSLDDVLPGDFVAVDAQITGEFNNKAVGINKPVTVIAKGSTLAGPDADNYRFITTESSTIVHADIAVRHLTADFSGLVANDKVYDSTPTATIDGNINWIGILPGDNVSIHTGEITGSFSDKNVGEGKPVAVDEPDPILSGTDASNYGLPDFLQLPPLSADITPLTISVASTGLSAKSRVYDRTTTATITGSLTPSGILPGDSVDVSGQINGAFDSKNVGSNKPVSVVVSDIELTGPDKSNYEFDATQTITLRADITPFDVILNYGNVAAKDKVYDRSTSATLTGTPTVSGALPGDSLTLAGTLTGTFANATVGNDKPVSIANSAVNLAGADAGNYRLSRGSAPVLNADITPKNLALEFGALIASNKVYDGTRSATVTGNPTLSGVITGDSVTLSSQLNGQFVDANAGNDKPVAVTVSRVALNGAGATNYAIASSASTQLTANIDPATLTFVATPATLAAGTAPSNLTGTVTGFVGGENLATATVGNVAFTTPATASSPAGQYPIVGGGITAANYTLVNAPENTTALTLQPATTTDPTIQTTVNGADKDRTTTNPLVPITPPPSAPAPRALRIVDNSGSGNVGLVAAAPTESTSETLAASESSAGTTSGATGSSAAGGGGASAFNRVNLAFMSRDEASQMLEARKGFKRKLLADGAEKLKEDPTLGDLDACQFLAQVDSGLCRMTDAQRESLLASPQSEEAAAQDTVLARTFAKARKIKAANLPEIERKLVVLFGIDQYEDSEIPSLDNAVADAAFIGKLFEEKLGYEVRLVKNAKKADLVRTLNQLSTESRRQDSVVLYYAGHGYMLDDTGLGYWLPSDARIEDPKTWLSNKDVSTMLASIPANQVAMISDSCYSGAFAKEQAVDAGRDLKPDEVLTKRSVVVLSSGGEEPVADGGRGGHSIFAWHLMQALNNVGNWRPGNTIFEEVQRAVNKEFPQTPRYGAALSAGHQSGGDYLFESRQLENE